MCNKVLTSSYLTALESGFHTIMASADAASGSIDEITKLLPVGETVQDATRPAPEPEHRVFKGRYVTLEPLSLTKHGDSIFAESHGPEGNRLWQYLFVGPFADRQSFDNYVTKQSLSKDPLFFAVIDNATGTSISQINLMHYEFTIVFCPI